MSDEKEPAPDPEIPDELRSKLGRKKRPAAFTPRSPEAESMNEKDEPDAPLHVKDLKPFFKKLRAIMKAGEFFTTVIEEREIRQPAKKGQRAKIRRVKEEVEIQVNLTQGHDGLPYPAEGITGEETRRIREIVYADSPKMDRLLGDLTPAFVEWLYLTHTYDASVRYSGRSTHVQAWAIANAA